MGRLLYEYKFFFKEPFNGEILCSIAIPTSKRPITAISSAEAYIYSHIARYEQSYQECSVN